MKEDLHPLEDLKVLSRIYRALGNDTRLRILKIISETHRPLHIKAISKQLDIDYAAIYRHIKILEDAGMIRIYEVGRSRVVEVIDVEGMNRLLEVTRKIIWKE